MKRMMLAGMAGAALALGAAGCRGLGYNDQSANNSLTPNTSQKEYTRTWQPTPGPNGQPGPVSQNVTTSAPKATQQDPANPNYTGAPSQSAPPASAPGH